MSDIPEIIRKTEREQRMYSLLMLKKYEEFLQYDELGKAEKPILFIGLEEYDHKIIEKMYNFNSIPDYVDIVVSTSNVIKTYEGQRQIRHFRHNLRRKHINFKTLDLYEESRPDEGEATNGKEEKKEEEEGKVLYSHIISLWSLRWTYNLSGSLTKMRKLLVDDGTAFLLIESKSQLYVALDKISKEMSGWRQILEPIIKSMSPFWNLKFCEAQEVIGDEIFKNGWAYLSTHDYCVVTYANFLKYQESLEQRYSFSSIIPSHKLEDFYNLLNTAFKEIGVINTPCEKVNVTVAYTTFVITSSKSRLQVPEGFIENAAERWRQHKKNLTCIEYNSPVESRKTFQKLFSCLSIGTSVSVSKVHKYDRDSELRSETSSTDQSSSSSVTPEMRAATPHKKNLIAPANRSTLKATSPKKEQAKSPKRTPEKRPGTPHKKNLITPAKKSSMGASTSKK